MNSLKIIIGLCIVALCLLQCKSTQNSTIYNDNFFPLNNGNYWEYNVIVTNKMSNKILKSDTLIDGKKYFKCQQKFSWSPEFINYLRNENGAIFSYNTKSKGESIVIPPNPQVGFKWKTIDNSWQYEIVSTNAKITTPTGTYENLLKIHSIELTSKDPEFATNYNRYFKNGIGEIASENNGYILMYLTDYKTK